MRIDIPDKSNPGFERLHGCEGTVVKVIEDDTGLDTGDERDSVLYRVALAKSEDWIDVRWRYIRPL